MLARACVGVFESNESDGVLYTKALDVAQLVFILVQGVITVVQHDQATQCAGCTPRSSSASGFSSPLYARYSCAKSSASFTFPDLINSITCCC